MGKAVERKEGKRRRPALSDLRKRTLKGKQQKLTSNSVPHSAGKKGRYWLKKGMMNEEDEEAEEAEDLRYMEQFYKTDVSKINSLHSSTTPRSIYAIACSFN